MTKKQHAKRLMYHFLDYRIIRQDSHDWSHSERDQRDEIDLFCKLKAIFAQSPSVMWWMGHIACWQTIFSPIKLCSSFHIYLNKSGRRKIRRLWLHNQHHNSVTANWKLCLTLTSRTQQLLRKDNMQYQCTLINNYLQRPTDENYYRSELKTLNLSFFLIFFLSSLDFYILVASADSLCKQFWPRSDLTKHQAWSGSKLFDTLIIFLKEFFENDSFEKKSADNKKKNMQCFPASSLDPYQALHFVETDQDPKCLQSYQQMRLVRQRF